MDYGIVLAAGASRRMGEPKALLEFEGTSLLARTVNAVVLAGARPLVVLGAGADLLRPHLGSVDYVVNEHWIAGMGTSVAAGFSALPDSALRAAIVAVDQPFIDAEHLGRLFAACTATVDAAATSYDTGHLGVPAVFSRRCFEALRTLDGDAGARELLRSGALEITAVRGANPRDIDTPRAWRQLMTECS